MNEDTKIKVFIGASIFVLGSGLGLLFANQKDKAAAEVQSRNVYPNASVAVSATASKTSKKSLTKAVVVKAKPGSICDGCRDFATCTLSTRQCA